MQHQPPKRSRSRSRPLTGRSNPVDTHVNSQRAPTTRPGMPELLEVTFKVTMAALPDTTVLNTAIQALRVVESAALSGAVKTFGRTPSDLLVELEIYESHLGDNYFSTNDGPLRITQLIMDCDLRTRQLVHTD